MTEIRLMMINDLKQVYEIVDSMHWGYFDSDIKRMIDSDPQGNFVAVDEGRIIGVNFSSQAQDFAFIGPVIVGEDFRGKKIGEDLMVAALDHLKSANVATIELDAVFPAAPLYRRLGFKDKYFSYRLRKVINWPVQPIKKFEKSMTAELLSFDQKMTGLERSNYLEKFCAEFPDSIYVIKKDKLQAYGLVRPRVEDTFWLGPLIAEDDEIALTLFDKICGVYSGKTLALGVLENNRRFIRHLRAQDFIHTIPALRMYLGERLRYDSNMYAILAPEKG